MAVFKCKMCGGALEINNNETVFTCEYCGSQQTLPKLDDDKRANLYDRANHFRRNNDFDKAMGIYEQILNEDKADAEAYWSLVLCRYGIEYVEDPSSHKRLPTVHRAQYTSIFDDEDYKSALEYADSLQKTVYEDEAKAINEIQKGILAISQNEDPFDVFICYKETDNAGRRTPDSVLANDLYHQLVQEGFKVFFARITLEDKIGTAYEPYIFAALNSAKVMVVLGTRPEYFNAVWVKNEWSRYLSLVKNSNGKKILIPAYKDFDPYDLPEEFSHLQAQDMSKLGFMQDLIRGIKKLAQSDEPKPTVVRETVVAGGNANVDALLKRVFIFLEDKDWKDADEYCEKVLDIDPENALAYLGKLLSELRVSKRASLRDYEKTFDDRNNYQKIIRYGDDQLTAEIKNCNEYIRTRNEKARLDGIYDSAKSIMLSAKTEDDYKRAAEKFKSIIPYMDSAELAEECIEKGKTATLENLYNSARNIMLFAHSEKTFKDAAKGFEAILDYKDSRSLRDECLEKAEVAREQAVIFEKDEKLDRATRLMSGDSLNDFQYAIELLEDIPGWKDADEKLAICREKYAELKIKVEAEMAEKKRKTEAAKLERERLIEAEQKAIKRKKATKKITKIVAVVAVIVAIISIITYIPYSTYKDAVALMEQGKYEEAIAEFGKISGYMDADEKVQECNTAILDNKYNDAVAMIDSGDIVGAYDLLITLGGHRDSAELAESIYFDYEVIKLQGINVGDYICWGKYEQDNDTSNGKENIEWLVVDIQDGKALVVSRYALDRIQYNPENVGTNWANCSLRTWLNNDFLNSAFSEQEQSRIQLSTVSATDSFEVETQDKIYILSHSEFEEYFSSDLPRECSDTPYAAANGGLGYYWARGTGINTYRALYINSNGGYNSIGEFMNDEYRTVRPAMWITIE